LNRVTSMDALIEALHREAKGGAQYEEVLTRITFPSDAVSRYRNFEPNFYTRNLIERCGEFELLALCWSAGQVSPVHDHGGSDGYIRVIEGVCEEVWYQCDRGPGNRVKTTPGRRLIAKRGDVSFINDELAWHTVGNPSDQPLVTLHLYSPPIDSCQYIDAESGEIKTKEMTYYSRDGVRA